MNITHLQEVANLADRRVEILLHLDKVEELMTKRRDRVIGLQLQHVSVTWESNFSSTKDTIVIGISLDGFLLNVTDYLRRELATVEQKLKDLGVELEKPEPAPIGD